MNEKREQLLDRMVRIYGFENEITIEFAKMCESPIYDENLLENLVKCHEEYPQYEEEEL